MVAFVYDIRLKLDAIKGLVPHELKKFVRSGQVSKWKRVKWDKLIGYEYYNTRETDLQILTKEINQLKEELRLQNVKNELLSIIHKAVVGSNEFGKLMHKNRVEIMDCTERNKKWIPVKEVVKLLNINDNTYYEWRALEKVKCEYSNNLLCIKRRPNQITVEEELKIIQLLQDPVYAHFPLISLIWKAHYENLVHASRNTWLRLKNQYQIVRERPKKLWRGNYLALRASYPNQYLHADVTHYRLLNGIDYYIYIVKDNFSRYIKSWEIAKSVNGEIRLKTFKDAIADINFRSRKKVCFITDQGAENRNKKITDFMSRNKTIEHKIAGLDIPYSNSMVERFNWDLKYLYLKRHNIYTERELKNIVAFAVKEHNQVKRLGCLTGQTPLEAYNGMPSRLKQIKAQWAEARRNRYVKVKKTVCCILKEM